MPFNSRIQYLAFVDNQKEIESDWDAKFGDRKNEIVFIGQEMNQKALLRELEDCLCTEVELSGESWKEGADDAWPIPRSAAMSSPEVSE